MKKNARQTWLYVIRVDGGLTEVLKDDVIGMVVFTDDGNCYCTECKLIRSEIPLIKRRQSSDQPDTC